MNTMIEAITSMCPVAEMARLGRAGEMFPKLGEMACMNQKRAPHVGRAPGGFDFPRAPPVL